jgi:hypothetical protein
MAETKKGVSVSEKCYICGRTDEEAPIFPIKFRGEDKWVCAKCLPRLIHG